MRVELLAFYGGPDQVMTVTSGLASILGLLLIFWNKVTATFFKVLNKIRGNSPSAASQASPKTPPAGTP
ncbi:MAG TPA: hypothetical protein VH437_04995 [Terriglobales bacterium]|jgi:hypothetical protein